MAKCGRKIGWSERGEKGGRPAGQHPENWKRKTLFSSVTIAGSPEKINRLKELANENQKSVSRFVLDNLVD